MASKPILIIGATGQQGGATLRALLSLPPTFLSAHPLLAVTRDAQSGSAKSLASKSSNVKLVQGDLNDVPSLFKAALKASGGVPIWGTLLVPMMGKDEEGQGKAVVDEAIKNDVKKLVFLSVDRGGDVKSWTSPTDVPHFTAKHNIELHLRDEVEKQPAGKKMGYTILRPTAFMDNAQPGMFTKIFLGMWHASLGATKKLQIISVRDIGIFAAKVFHESDTGDKWDGKAMGLVSAEISCDEFEGTFKKVTGEAPGRAFDIPGRALMMVNHDMRSMFAWFAKAGYGADVEVCKRENPDMLDLEGWLRGESKFTAKA